MSPAIRPITPTLTPPPVAPTPALTAALMMSRLDEAFTLRPSLSVSVALPPISESVLALTMVSMPLTATPALPEAAMVPDAPTSL